MTAPAFEVDKAGLEKILARRGKEFAVLELVQNSLDERVTAVAVRLTQTPKSRGYYTIEVEDDCPSGFADLSHAYTLFAESRKKVNPEQRGRFNLGEKLVLACCRKARIVTTTGAIEWEGNTRRSLRRRRELGSIFMGELRMTHEEAALAVQAVRSVIVPSGITLTVNGEEVRHRHARRQIVETLPTEKADAEGYLRSTKRKTTINVYDVRGYETPTLYEMGIPVVEIECPWHVDVQQKVPLNTDRDNVTPGYLRKVRAAVLNEMHDSLPEEAARGAWVDDALESDLLGDEAVEAVLTARYGDKRVIRDPSDPEATNIAVAKGYSVIEPGSFNRQQWGTIRRSGAALPAGKVTPSPKPYSEDGDPLNVRDPESYTPGMERIVRLARYLAVELADVIELEVQIATEVTWPYGATYGRRGPRRGSLTFNLGRLGHAWFDAELGPKHVQLIVHELGHHFSSNHLSAEYHDALCELGAKAAFLDPDEMRLVFEGRLG